MKERARLVVRGAGAVGDAPGRVVRADAARRHAFDMDERLRRRRRRRIERRVREDLVLDRQRRRRDLPRVRAGIVKGPEVPDAANRLAVERGECGSCGRGARRRNRGPRAEDPAGRIDAVTIAPASVNATPPSANVRIEPGAISTSPPAFAISATAVPRATAASAAHRRGTCGAS